MITQENPNPAIDAIRRLLGLSPKHASAIMPAGDNSQLGFPGVLVGGADEVDAKTWAQKEYERDHKGWEQVP